MGRQFLFWENQIKFIHFKNVIENTDGYLEIADLGLLPGGKIKLIKSTSINLDSSVK